MKNILGINLVSMKKIVFLMLVAVGVMAVSCSPAVVDREPIVTFYMDNEEITDNSVEVPLNSYREIKIKTEAIGVNSNRAVHYYWQYATGYPVELVVGMDNLVLNGTSFGTYIPELESSGMVQFATFRMIFSDTTYQSGDECRLSVSLGNYTKYLKVLVQ